MPRPGSRRFSAREGTPGTDFPMILFTLIMGPGTAGVNGGQAPGRAGKWGRAV